jgi:uncharacterized membrane protein
MHDLILFLGHFHPVAVHLPIGLLLLAGLMDLLGRSPSYAFLRPAAPFVLMLGSASALLSVLLGKCLSQSGEYDAGLLGWHERLGYALTGVSLALWLIRRNEAWMRGWGKRIYMPLHLICTLLLMGTGHAGGSLTHGADYLAWGAGRAEASAEAQPADLASQPVYAALIQPMLDQRCVSCHGTGKRKGKLRLDSPEQWQAGGEHGPVVVPGDAAGSELMSRLLLPRSDEKHMPPDGRKPLSTRQIQILEWWIESGADLHKLLAELGPPPEVLALIEAEAGLSSSDGLNDRNPPPASPEALRRLAQQNVLVLPLAQELHWLQASARPSFSGADLGQLAGLAEQLAWLDLRGAALEDYAGLAALPALRRLDLSGASFQGKDLAHLQALPHLEWLNLYGTDIGDADLGAIASLPALKKINLSGTAVSPAGLASLQQSRPGLRATGGSAFPDSLSRH